MHDDQAAAALIERIIAGAHIPSRAGRDDLRRELRAHFEDAGTSPEAMRRFGSEAMLTESWRQVYRWDYAFLYLLKIAASIVASIAVALLIEVVVNLRVEVTAEVWRLAPQFSYATVMAVAVVLGLVTAWEVARRPLTWWRAAVAISAYAAVCALAELATAYALRTLVTATILVGLGYACSRLQPRPAKLLLTFAVFAAAEYGIHSALSVTIAPGRAIVAGAVLAAVWACTVLVLGHVEQAFVSWFEPPHPRAA